MINYASLKMNDYKAYIKQFYIFRLSLSLKKNLQDVFITCIKKIFYSHIISHVLCIYKQLKNYMLDSIK